LKIAILEKILKLVIFQTFLKPEKFSKYFEAENCYLKIRNLILLNFKSSEINKFYTSFEIRNVLKSLKTPNNRLFTQRGSWGENEKIRKTFLTFFNLIF